MPEVTFFEREEIIPKRVTVIHKASSILVACQKRCSSCWKSPLMGPKNRESLSGATSSKKIAMVFKVPQNLEVTAFHWICQKGNYPNVAPVPYMGSESSTDSEKSSAEDPEFGDPF